MKQVNPRRAVNEKLPYTTLHTTKRSKTVQLKLPKKPAAAAQIVSSTVKKNDLLYNLLMVLKLFYGNPAFNNQRC